MSITTIGKQLIHYEVLGRGEPVIFIHGWLGSWRYWWSSMQSLSAQHRSFALDLWGFGDSSKLPDCYTVSAYADMVAQFIDQLAILQPVTLVGHALGAAVALRFATKHPGRVQKLAAVALPVRGSSIDNRLLTLDASSFIAKAMGKAANYPEIESEIRKSDQTAVNRLAAEIAREDFSNELANCPCPILLVYGGQDSVVQAPANGNRHHNNSANARYYVSLDNCHHFPMLEETVKFNRLLLEFIHADETLTELTPKEYWQRRTR